MSEEHGYKRYSTHKDPCRCEVCRAAKTSYVKQRRQERTGLPFGDPRHGTRNGYDNYSCRCAECVKAKAATRPPDRRRSAR